MKGEKFREQGIWIKLGSLIKHEKLSRGPRTISASGPRLSMRPMG